MLASYIIVTVLNLQWSDWRYRNRTSKQINEFLKLGTCNPKFKQGFKKIIVWSYSSQNSLASMATKDYGDCSLNNNFSKHWVHGNFISFFVLLPAFPPRSLGSVHSSLFAILYSTHKIPARQIKLIVSGLKFSPCKLHGGRDRIWMSSSSSAMCFRV